MADPLQTRREAAAVICDAANASFGAAYEPFMLDAYTYRHLIGRLTQPPWDTIMAQPPVSLIPEYPYVPSPYRPGKMAVWDAVVGIPTAAIRPPRLCDFRTVPTIRSTNRSWLGDTLTQLARVGPIGTDGAFVRPAGPQIVDLMYDPQGWQLLEAAHILAHRRPMQRDMSVALRQALVELVTCRTYGLPIDITGETRTLDRYGIELYASPRLRDPVLYLPWVGDGSPIPDRTVSYIVTGVFIEPIPRGVVMQNDDWLECNRWTCMPTMVVTAGWECVDVITHFPLGVPSLRAARPKTGYLMSPADLMPAETIPALLQAGFERYGVPVVDEQHPLVGDWLNSEGYKAALLATPPFPCRDCIAYNARTEGAPARPKPHWEGAKEPYADRLVRLEWEAAQARILRIATAATVFGEARMYGGRTKAARIRAQRTTQYHRILNYRLRVERLKIQIKKAMRDGVPSKALALKRQLDALPQP